MRKALASKVEKLAQDFNDAPVMCDCEITQARSSAAQGAFTMMGSLLKKALQFAGPSYVEAMAGTDPVQEERPASQYPQKATNLGKRPVGFLNEYSVENSGTLMQDDSASLGGGTMRNRMGELELSELECTRIADINLGEEITPDSDDGTSVNQASTSGASSHPSSVSDDV